MFFGECSSLSTLWLKEGAWYSLVWCCQNYLRFWIFGEQKKMNFKITPAFFRGWGKHEQIRFIWTTIWIQCIFIVSPLGVPAPNLSHSHLHQTSAKIHLAYQKLLHSTVASFDYLLYFGSWTVKLFLKIHIFGVLSHLEIQGDSIFFFTFYFSFLDSTVVLVCERATRLKWLWSKEERLQHEDEVFQSPVTITVLPCINQP